MRVQEILCKVGAIIVLSAVLIIYNKYIIHTLQEDALKQCAEEQATTEKQIDVLSDELENIDEGITPPFTGNNVVVDSNDPNIRYACCYRDANDPIHHVGRPFPLSEQVSSAVHSYLQHPGIRHEDKIKNLMPQPVTGFSANHYSEHLKQIRFALKLFKGKRKIIIYDLGMSLEQQKYVQGNESFIYRKLDFTQFPDHVSILTTYAWKTLIWRETLMEYDAITWFDTSMNFLAQDAKHFEKVVSKYIVNKRASMLYYVHPAGHSTSWATHAGMFSYLPSNISAMGQRNENSMNQANGVILYNTIDFKENIMKWALLCVLTKDCIAPESLWLSPIKVNKWCPKGKETKNDNYICHRYDQSLFAILAYNYYKYDGKIYQIQDTNDFLGVPQRVG